MKTLETEATKDGRPSGLAVAPCSASFPAEFRGCQWNDGWEFDAPCVIYYPAAYRRFGIGGNTGEIDHMVEDMCFDIGDGRKPHDGGLAHECEWRGWGKRFDRRRAARHVVIKVRWENTRDGWMAHVVSRDETYGLPSKPNDQAEPRRL